MEHRAARYFLNSLNYIGLSRIPNSQ